MSDPDQVFPYMFASLGVTIVGLLIFMLVKSLTADGSIEYCYVEVTVHQVPDQPNIVLYHLQGFRPWRSDRAVSVNLHSLEEATVEAKLIGCQVK